MRCPPCLADLAGVVFGMLLYGVVLGLAQERPTLPCRPRYLVGIDPAAFGWVQRPKLFEKHGLQVKPIYLPRAAGRPALLSGDIQIYFPPVRRWCRCVWVAPMSW